MILITGDVILTPDNRDRMIALGAEHSARSRGEAGCLGHHCHIDVENDLRLVFVEEWESVEAARAGDSHLCGGGCDGDADGVMALSRQGCAAFPSFVMPDLIRHPWSRASMDPGSSPG